MNFLGVRYRWTTTAIILLVYYVMTNNGSKNDYQLEEVTENSVGEAVSPANEDYETKSEETPEEFALFDSWKEWRDPGGCKICDCDPSKNENLSPVKIESEKAVIDRKAQTLLVYSDTPPQGLYRLKYFWQENNKSPIVDALNINSGNDEIRLFEETYISGLGDPSYRFFKSAMILMGNRNKSFGPDRSLHQIDGKTFPMEIVMMFAARAYVNETDRVSQVTDIDNPVFHPIINLIDDIQRTYDNNRMDPMSIAQLVDQQTRLKAMMRKEHKEAGVAIIKRGETVLVRDYGLKIKEFQNRIQDIGNSETVVRSGPPRIAQLKAEIVSVDDIINEVQSKKTILERDREATQSMYLQKLETGEAIRGEDDEDLEKALDLRQEVREKITEINSLIRRRSELTINKDEEIDSVNRAINKQKEYGWNVDPQKSTYIEVEELKKQIEHFTIQLGEKMKVLDSVAKLTNKLQKQLTVNGEILMKDDFQISWLLPPTGGYYSYSGSNPVPPCTQRSQVIVMENHINISSNQFEQLIKGFGLKEGEKEIIINNIQHDPLDISIPPIWPIGKRQVIYNPKNLQFINDDGFHMTSAERRRFKDLLHSQTNSGIQNSILGCKFWAHWFLLISFLVY